MNDISLALIGGALIGISAATWLALSGKTAGVSGMIFGMVSPQPGQFGWQAAFLLGLLLGGAGLALIWPERIPDLGSANLVWLAAAGLLVGFGTRLGEGCTSGHGVCGIGRFSRRSIVATGTFMTVAAATVFIVRHVVEA